MKSNKREKIHFFFTKYERHLIMTFDYMLDLGVDAVLDILLDHGFTTKWELTRFEDEEQNVVEFVQDLVTEEKSNNGGIKFITNFEPNGEDSYH